MSRLMSNMFMYQTALFTKEECELILTTAGNAYEFSGVEAGGFHRDENIRNSNNLWFDLQMELPEIYRKLWTKVQFLNQSGYGLDITGLGELTQMTLYNEGEYYNEHKDDIESLYVRKLSTVVQLTDPSEYKGGALMVEGVEAPRGQGDLVIFPSIFNHKVCPIMKGNRYSMVNWFTGPEWR